MDGGASPIVLRSRRIRVILPNEVRNFPKVSILRGLVQSERIVGFFERAKIRGPIAVVQGGGGGVRFGGPLGEEVSGEEERVG